MTASTDTPATADAGPSSLPDPRFLDDRLAHWAATTPDAEAITYLGRTWTWAECDDRVRRLAGALRELGVGRGDVVAFLDKNHPACVELTPGRGLARRGQRDHQLAPRPATRSTTPSTTPARRCCSSAPS